MKYNKPLKDSMKDWCQPADNAALYPKVAAGDEEARQQMIASNMPMVVSIVDGYLKSNKDFDYLRDDLTSEGFLSLTRVVDALSTKPLTSERAVSSYLFTSIRRVVQEAARHSPYESTDKDWSERTMARFKSVEDVDASDVIDACCKTPSEHKLVRLRQRGYSLREIAKRLRTNYSAVQTGYTAIEGRYTERTLSA
jgi:RNA polymerase sigma factor (sigma-70 family)